MAFSRNSFIPKEQLFWVALIGAVLMLCLTGSVEAAANNDYLQYQEPKSTSFNSWFSTLAYIFSLLLTFAAVLAMAYFASRFLGLRMSGGGWSKLKNGRVLQTIPIGTNKAVTIVNAAGKILVLGVTDSSVNLLTEITDEEEIEKLTSEIESNGIENEPFEQVFNRQMQSLQQMVNRFPKTFSRKQLRGQQEQEKNHVE